jgi:hypothetical protein
MIKLCIDLEITDSFEIQNHIKYLQMIYNMKKLEEKIEIQTFTLEHMPKEEIEVPEVPIIEVNEVVDEVMKEDEPPTTTTKYVCECGVMLEKKNKNRHNKSKTHLEFLLTKKEV